MFIGESDTGKTAIIRALKWLVNNKPSGKDYFNNLMNKANVKFPENRYKQIQKDMI